MNTDNQSETRKISKRDYLLIISGILFVVAAAAGAYEIYLPHPARSGIKEVAVPQGFGSRMIAALLKEQGIIGSKWAFVFYVSIRGEASSLKPGSYKFFDTAAIPDIARDLVAGSARERSIVIPEGWNIRDIATYVAKQGMGEEQSDFTFLRNPPADFVRKFPYLSELPKDAGLEGYLFPDTYRIFQDAKIQDITAKMLDNFGAKLMPDMRQEIARQKKSVHEILTMASLIEKEVASDSDRAIVSGILWKRRDAGIPLQVDASIVYIKSQKSAGKEIGGTVSLEDLKINSPYNTYRYRGLPPSPIANPGMSAIRAALYPRQSPYLYYLSTPDGRTIFSRTLDEHNAAKAKYLRTHRL